MAIEIIDLCSTLIECLNKVRSTSGLNAFNAATGFIDHEGLSYIYDYLSDAAEVKILVGDHVLIPRRVYENWHDVIKVYYKYKVIQ